MPHLGSDAERLLSIRHVQTLLHYTYAIVSWLLPFQYGQETVLAIFLIYATGACSNIINTITAKATLHCYYEFGRYEMAHWTSGLVVSDAGGKRMDTQMLFELQSFTGD